MSVHEHAGHPHQVPVGVREPRHRRRAVDPVVHVQDPVRAGRIRRQTGRRRPDAEPPDGRERPDERGVRQARSGRVDRQDGVHRLPESDTQRDQEPFGRALRQHQRGGHRQNGPSEQFQRRHIQRRRDRGRLPIAGHDRRPGQLRVRAVRRSGPRVLVGKAQDQTVRARRRRNYNGS